MDSPASPSPSRDLKWFHVTFNTYGTWLYGDPRGFRTRHHREHVEGDYKNPPPAGLYEQKNRRSRDTLKGPPVRLKPAQRRLAGQALLDMLEHVGATVVAIAVGAEHVHIVVRLPDASARQFIARAKKHAYFLLRKTGLPGSAWAKRSRTLPIKDRSHQLNAMRYVSNHRSSRAWVWIWGEPRPQPSTIPESKRPSISKRIPPATNAVPHPRKRHGPQHTPDS